MIRGTATTGRMASTLIAGQASEQTGTLTGQARTTTFVSTPSPQTLGNPECRPTRLQRGRALELVVAK
jgi:hypothetical protein